MVNLTIWTFLHILSLLKLAFTFLRYNLFVWLDTSRQSSEENRECGLGVGGVELHADTDVLVQVAGQFLMECLLLLETWNEYLEELFQRRDSQIFSAVIVDRHLLHFGVLFYQLLLLGF